MQCYNSNFQFSFLQKSGWMAVWVHGLTYYFSIFSFKLRQNKMWNSFLIVFIFKFVNWLILDDYQTVISYQAFIAKYFDVIDLTLDGLLIIQKQPREVFYKKGVQFRKFHSKTPVLEFFKKRLQQRNFPVEFTKLLRIASGKQLRRSLLKRDSHAGVFIPNLLNIWLIFNCLKRFILTFKTRSLVWNFKKNAGNFTVLICCAAAN